MARSYRGQTLHYFQRADGGVARTPVLGPAAWHGAELAQQRDWLEPLSPAQIDGLESALEGVRAADLALDQIDRDAFRLTPELEKDLARWRQILARGRGFHVLRGLPVTRWGQADSERVFWGLGAHLGVPGAQNPAGDLLGHVLDTGDEANDPQVRRYRTAGDIRFHCDAADVVALLCLETPRRGGASRLASSVAVYNALLDEMPELVERLYAPFALDLRNEGADDGPQHLPIPPCRFADGMLRTFFHADYFHSAQRHADVAPFTADEARLLERFEAIANTPEFRLDMQFEPGDVQLVSNHSVVHARTAYEDGPSRRHLLRLWLSLDDPHG